MDKLKIGEIWLSDSVFGGLEFRADGKSQEAMLAIFMQAIAPHLDTNSVELTCVKHDDRTNYFVKSKVIKNK